MFILNLEYNNNKIINKNITQKQWKTIAKQNFFTQIYYNIIFYYNSQNIQIQVLENKKQKIVTKHTLRISDYFLPQSFIIVYNSETINGKW